MTKKQTEIKILENLELITDLLVEIDKGLVNLNSIGTKSLNLDELILLQDKYDYITKLTTQLTARANVGKRKASSTIKIVRNQNRKGQNRFVSLDDSFRALKELNEQQEKLEKKEDSNEIK